MNFIKSAIYLATAALLAFTTPVETQAQFRLPASHTNQHNDLLAKQRPVGDKFRIDASDAFYRSVRDREQADNFTEEIYSQYWESQSVNPYTGAAIPATAKLDVSGYVHPVPGAVTSNFGYRPRFGRVHKGIDLRLKIGDTVKVAFDGVVRLTKFERKGYGYYVVVRHDNGMETVYGHLSRFLVKPNQRVRAGEAIALGGNTGRSTGPHLHFETRFMGLTINPTEIIDFETGMPHGDVYAFSKSDYDKKMNSFPKGRKYAKSKSTKKKRKTGRSRRK